MVELSPVKQGINAMTTIESNAEQKRQARRSRTAESRRAFERCKFIRDISVGERYDISRPTVWRWVRDGLLPPPESLGPNTKRWSVVTLDTWDASRAETNHPK